MATGSTVLRDLPTRCLKPPLPTNCSAQEPGEVWLEKGAAALPNPRDRLRRRPALPARRRILRSRAAATRPTALDDGDTGVRWQDSMSPQQTLRVEVTASRSTAGELDFAMLRIRGRIVDRLRVLEGERPSIDRQNPDVRVRLSRWSHGHALRRPERRGALRAWLRADKGEAPQQDVVAGCWRSPGWMPSTALDPFCGSGTIVIEAACIASGRAPGLDRSFALERLGDLERGAWRACSSGPVTRSMTRRRRDRRLRHIDARDRPGPHNAAPAGLAAQLADGRLRLEVGDARTATPPSAHGMIISNPPYGEERAAFGDRPSDDGRRRYHLKAPSPGWHAGS